MGRLKIVWTATAAKQRAHIFNYWNQRNKSTEYSKKLRQAIHERTEQLSTFPALGKVVAFPNTRVISLKHYRIFYQVKSDLIIIIAFWDNRNDPEVLLKLLK